MESLLRPTNGHVLLCGLAHQLGYIISISMAHADGMALLRRFELQPILLAEVSHRSHLRSRMR
jgi:hypothetical protein